MGGGRRSRGWCRHTVEVAAGQAVPQIERKRPRGGLEYARISRNRRSRNPRTPQCVEGMGETPAPLATPASPGRRERHLDVAAHAGGRERELGAAVELVGDAALDQGPPEAAPLGLLNRRAAVLAQSRIRRASAVSPCIAQAISTRPAGTENAPYWRHWSPARAAPGRASASSPTAGSRPGRAARRLPSVRNGSSVASISTQIGDLPVARDEQRGRPGQRRKPPLEGAFEFLRIAHGSRFGMRSTVPRRSCSSCDG